MARELLRVRRGVRISTPARHQHVWTRRCSDFRGPAPGPPPQFQKGWGICFGAHGLGVPYKDWLKVFGSPDVDALHESLNIQYSVCGPINGKVSTDLSGGGVGVLHVTKSFKDTARFDAARARVL